MQSLLGRPSALVWVAVLGALSFVGCGHREETAAPASPPPAQPSGDVLLDRDGALAPEDTRGTVSFVDRYDVPVAAGEHVRVTLTSSAFDPVLEVTPPRGAPLSNDDLRGDRTRSEIELVATQAGQLKVQVTSFVPNAQGAYHVHVERVRSGVPVAPPVAVAAPVRRHHIVGAALSSIARPPGGAAPAAPTATAPGSLRVGDHVSGTLAEGDLRLESGELADVYVIDVAAPTDLTIQMQSSQVDAYLVVRGPNGAAWENDDSGGTRDASVAIAQAAPGQYQVVATTFRAGMTGSYELKALSSRDAPAAPVAGTGGGGGEQVIAGELATGDRQLASGEFNDEHRFTWPVGTAVHIEARSTAFDTYLILHSPSGPQRDNDDQSPGITNAALDFVVQHAGEHRVLVTSYRPGETGRYELAVRGGGGAAPGTPTTPPPGTPPPGTPPSTPPPGTPPVAAGQPVRGALAAGDPQLSSGEFADTHRMTFPAGAPVQIRVESSAFDSYLIVRSPSGRQEDNDDYQPGALNAGIDIPAAEAGEYQVVVTSYRPGETGAYVLTASGGSATGMPPPQVPGVPGVPPSAPGVAGSRVWVLSVGISDYPGGANDLPECANDAVKIAEALRNQGLTAPEREFLLTDGRATTAAIRDAMTRIASQITPEDTFVFFYSGHGGQNESRSADVRELDGIDEYLFVHDGPLMDDDFGRLMDGVRARTSLVAIDACFAGGFAKDVVTRPGVVGMFSSEEDVTSAVAGQFQAGGYLSHFLRLGIQGEADIDPRDRVMTTGELTHYVWQQYGRHASDVRTGMGYQQLVVDRGAVRATQELWRNR